jgi:hypothetical protein
MIVDDEYLHGASPKRHMPRTAPIYEERDPGKPVKSGRRWTRRADAVAKRFAAPGAGGRGGFAHAMRSSMR